MKTKYRSAAHWPVRVGRSRFGGIRRRGLAYALPQPAATSQNPRLSLMSAFYRFSPRTRKTSPSLCPAFPSSPGTSVPSRPKNTLPTHYDTITLPAQIHLTTDISATYTKSPKNESPKNTLTLRIPRKGRPSFLVIRATAPGTHKTRLRPHGTPVFPMFLHFSHFRFSPSSLRTQICPFAAGPVALVWRP